MNAAKPKSKAGPAQLIALILIVGTVAAYWQVHEFEFVSTDDTDYVYNNPIVQQGLTWSGAKWAFTTFFDSNWHPLTWLSHMLDCQLYGLKPGGHHVTNLLLHIANVLLLFHVLRRMTGAIWQSAFVAAVLAWHPLHVESVAWVAERKDVLSTFLWILTLWSYANYVQASKPKPRRLHYGLALLFFALGLMSKPMLVTLPFVLLLLDWWPLRRMPVSKTSERNLDSSPSPPLGERAGERGKNKPHSIGPKSTNWSQLIIEKLPFFAMALAACILTFKAQDKAGSVMSTEIMPMGLRMENALTSYVVYFCELFWPVKLAVFYPFPTSILVWQVAGSALLLATLSLAALIWLKKKPWFAVGWFWFLGTLVPVIGLVQVGLQARADRYTYIPYIGLSIILAWGVPEALASWKPTRSVSSLQAAPTREPAKTLTPNNSLALAWSAAFALAACIFLTRTQASTWQNSQALFQHAVEVTSNNYAAENNLGTLLAAAGNLDEAQAHFEEAVRIRPDYDHAQFNLGNLMCMKGRLEEAAMHYRESLKTNPQIPDKYLQLGKTYMLQHKTDEGIATLLRAVELNPDFEAARYNLGLAYLVVNRASNAIAQFQKAVELAPNDVNAQRMLSSALAGVPDEAILNYQSKGPPKPDN